ncbi:hypothetical protein J4558_08855 [Leptolyngbya sp. 15MV]|nr:hypothetical protein J4558_08855 [Leptolyngbya sp. 15MV]
MTAKSYKYIGIRYKQGNGGQDLLTFCASAQEIRAWAGVPTKTERFHGGFQRALTDRYKKISQFFDAGHSSPTSIVVAFRSQALALDDLGFPSAWPGTANGLTAMPTFTQVSFTADDADPDTADLEQLRTAVCAMLKPRLEESGDTAENTTEEAEEDDEEDAPSIEDAPGEEGEDEPVLDVGHSKLRQFYDFLNSPEAVEAWLTEQNAKKAEITARGPRGRAEREFIQIDPDSRLRAALVSLLKPAMIVDGQHRVSGAYHAESGPITFNVCAIKDADWVEQVFQFVVLNKLARPISSSFLTALLNTSLTNSEVGRITDKLKAVGLQETDRILMQVVNFDSKSPFVGMVSQPGDMAGVNNRGTLSDKGMLAVAKRWYGLSSGPNSAAEIAMFMPAMGETQLMKARQKWRAGAGVWPQFFFAFWNVVKERYQPEGAWQQGQGFNLLYIVTLQTLQSMFLENKRRADATFQSVDDFKDQVRRFFERVPGALFLNWTATGLQSGKGPEHIKSAVEMAREGRQMATIKKDSPLFQ